MRGAYGEGAGGGSRGGGIGGWVASESASILAAARAALRSGGGEFGPCSPAQRAQEPGFEKASTLGRTRRAGRLRAGRAAERPADRTTRAIPSAWFTVLSTGATP